MIEKLMDKVLEGMNGGGAGGSGGSDGGFSGPTPSENDIQDVVNEKNESGMRNAEDLCYEIIKLQKFCENLDDGIKFIEERYKQDEEDFQDDLDDYYDEGDLDNDLDLLD